MRKANEVYLSILRLELEDLHEDIEVMIEACTKEKEKGRLTNYVFMENIALFKNELLGVDAFGKIVDETDTAAFDTLEAMVNHLKMRFKEKIRTAGLAEVICIYVDRKLEKVQKYVTQGSQRPQPVVFRSEVHA